MKDFQSIKEWLNEQKKEKEQTFGCVMMEPEKIKGWEENHLEGIDEEDIFIKPSDNSYGLEEKPHITILFGIHEDEVDPSVIVDMIEQKMEPLKVKILEVDVFEKEEYDVVKYNIPVAKQLQGYRDMFMDSFENTQTYPKFQPHMTIAYCKPGTGKKYKRKLSVPFDVYFNKGVYSYHKLNKDKDEDKDDLVRRVVNLESEKEEKTDSGIIKSKPLIK